MEFWNFIMGALFIWTCSISPCGKLEERERERKEGGRESEREGKGEGEGE